MALMPWNDKYSVGVRAIDKQHAGLVQTLNELHEAMMKGHAKTVTGTLLHKLVDYTRDHFSAEEKMLATAKYPGLAQHLTLHHELSRQVGEYVERF